MNTEDLLTDVLHDRVERTDYPSTPLSTVAGRAGAIRSRRRRTTALAAAAAVALVTVPGAIWLGRSPGGTARPGQTLSSGPTSSPSEQTSAPAGPALQDLPQGAEPGIDYLVGDTYVAVNGDRISSPTFAHAETAMPARGGILAAVPPGAGMNDRPDGTPVYLVSGGSAQKLGCGADRFAMSTDGVESAYWLADSCAVGSSHGSLFSGVNNTMGEAGPGSVASPVGAVYSPIGIVRQGVVVNDVGTDRSLKAPAIIAPDRTTPLVQLQEAGGSDENNDVVSGQLAGDSSTGAIVDASTGVVRLRVPGWILGQFSMDGKYVLGIQRTDSLLGDNYAVFDTASGHRLIAFAAQSDPVWDTNDTLLSIGRGTDTVAIVRIDLQGSWSRATPIVHSASYWAGYRLATRP
jgi:hypothetical protein